MYNSNQIKSFKRIECALAPIADNEMSNEMEKVENEQIENESETDVDNSIHNAVITPPMRYI